MERRRFEARWSRLRVEYAANGMEESTITEMYKFDLREFNSNRRYAEHTQAFSRQEFSDDGDTAGEDSSPLLKKFFESFTTRIGDSCRFEGNNWIEEIEDEGLWKGVSKLSDGDRELLTLYIFYGYTLSKIAKRSGVTQPAISKKLSRIRKFLAKYR